MILRFSLIKKLNEISTLCGIEACAIIYNRNDAQPEVWPSDSGVQMVLTRFRRMSELKKNKKMLNQESLLRQIVTKSQEQLKKLRNENRKREVSHMIFQYLTVGGIYDNPSLIDLNDISWLIDYNLNEIEKKINRIQIEEVQQAPMIENEGDQQQAYMHHVQGLESGINTF
ncbi:hypothetical protein Fmac_014278 [Flemingia macrophylla]|uniref:MADS-box domain-containing protein n=1 Tax=Flemingia macrophylla TaxID=520843 RepID=A0ABD1MDB0_9FABA